MGIYKSVYSTIALLAISFSANTMAAESPELKLATDYGCIACHAPVGTNTVVEGKARLPIGPSLQEIAARYHNNERPDKYQELYRIVKHGSSPYRSKWQGEISGLAMPPNDDTISDLDIHRLLVWILTSNQFLK